MSFSHRDFCVLKDVLTAHYDTSSKYMSSNKLVINPDKTHLMVMAPRKLASRSKKVTVQAGEFTMKPTESERLLGIKIHQSMTWNPHVRDDKGSVSLC